MDVSSFLKWNDSGDNETTKKGKRYSSTGSTLSIMQDNISQFFQNGLDASDALTPIKSRDSNSSSTIDKNTTSPTSLKIKQSVDNANSQITTASTTNQFTDKLVERLISMALPSTNELTDSKKLDQRLKIGKTRPSLSVPLMSKNFIQLNSRLSFPFETIDNLIRLFQWENPFQTVTVLLIITHLILTPIPLLLSFPFFFIVLYIMVPNFKNLHYPDNKDSILGKSNPLLSEGPNLKKIEFAKPAPEISREFIINLTDLQNHMLLYVNLWDSINNFFQKFGYFVDDGISSFWFISLLIIGGFLIGFGESIVLKLLGFIKILLISGVWGFTLTFHPQFHDYVYDLVYSESTRYFLLNKTNKFESFLSNKIIVEEIDEPQEQREVEIFEIQQLDDKTKEWKLVFYLNDDFTRFSNLRLNYFVLDLPIGSNSLSLIKPPNENWVFTDNNWKIDLNPKAWVQENLLFEFVTIDDETKWVYDKVEETSNEEVIQFRRRRWTRSVGRNAEIEGSNKDLTNSNDNNTIKTSSSHSNLTTGLTQF